MTLPITEDWLRDVGFKWHEFERQNAHHWLLWLGDAIPDSVTCHEDMGIELAPGWWKNRNGDDVGSLGKWFCWFRSDGAGRYHRFIHVRHLATAGEVILLCEAITGQPWNPANHIYGSAHTPERADRIRRDLDRVDVRMREEPWRKWYEVERDDTRGRALPEHMQVAENVRTGKAGDNGG